MFGTQRPWWGDFELEIGQTACRRVGPVTLWVRRDADRWLIAHGTTPSGGAPPDCAEGIPADPENLHTYAVRRTSRGFRLEPRLADRPVVWRPESRLFIAPGEEISIFLRVPLWIGLYIEGFPSLRHEFPSCRLSDTWFGSPLEKGGSAYAAERKAFLRSDEFQMDAAHAVIPIAIRNASTALLPLERLNLPVPFLSLFEGAHGFWTQRVTLERDEEDEELALLRLEKGLPREAVSGKLISGPREQDEKHVVFQAFSRIFR